MKKADFAFEIIKMTVAKAISEGKTIGLKHDLADLMNYMNCLNWHQLQKFYYEMLKNFRK